MSRITYLIECEAEQAERVVSALRASGVAWREVRYAAVDAVSVQPVPAPEVLFRVRLTAGLRLWSEPGGKAGNIIYPPRMEYDVLQIKGGWLRVPGGWIPDGNWLVRLW